MWDKIEFINFFSSCYDVRIYKMKTIFFFVHQNEAKLKENFNFKRILPTETLLTTRIILYLLTCCFVTYVFEICIRLALLNAKCILVLKNDLLSKFQKVSLK